MHNKLIIRFEGKNGLGIYRQYGGFDEDCKELGVDLCGPNHPTPTRDIRLRKNLKKVDLRLFEICGDFHFGFCNFKQLISWLSNPAIFDVMEMHGIRAIVYAGEVIHGETQSVVRITSKKEIKTISLKYLKKRVARAA